MGLELLRPEHRLHLFWALTRMILTCLCARALKGWYQAEQNNRIGQTVLFSVWRHEQPTLQLQMD